MVPDGATIAFIRASEDASGGGRPADGRRDHDCHRSTPGTVVHGPDGSDQRQMEVQPADSDWSVVGGDWAPDGDRFAVEVRFGDNHDIVVVDTVTRTGVRLTDDPAADTSPTWSPDGSAIAFSTGRWGSGTGQQRDRDDPAGRSRPAARHRTTAGTITTPTGCRPRRRWNRRPRGHHLPGPISARAGVAQDGPDPRTRPQTHGVEDLFAIDPDTGERTNLTADLISQFAPSWSPDRSQIAFGAYDGRTEARGLYVMRRRRLAICARSPRAGPSRIGAGRLDDRVHRGATEP